MNLNEFEEKIKVHGQGVKNYITPPFDIEREELNMKKSSKFKISFLLSATIVCMLAVTAFAAYNYLTAKQTAEKLGNHILAESFSDSEIPPEIITDGNYKVALLGITSGKNISEFESVIPERTYAAIAIEKTNGESITYDDEILVTPLIQGLAPWKYNIFTLDGGRMSQIIDGVLYTIVEFDSVEYFADRHIYLAVLDQTFYSTEAYDYDEKTGIISKKESYNGTNILFDLNLDKSKADPKKAAEYLDKLNRQLENPEGSEDSKDLYEEETAENEKKL